jgi:hypothetical protein
MPPVKPLGRKAYGSTAHVQGSRSGPGDWYCHEGQTRIATARARASDVVVVSEKVDGSCCAVARIDGGIHPLIRAGYRARDSVHALHHVFAAWVEEYEEVFRRLLVEDGERAVADWLLVAHGTVYDIADDLALFPIFDVFAPVGGNGKSDVRLPYAEMVDRVARAGLVHVPYLHVGGALPVAAALEALGPLGRHHATEKPEGVVYKVETDGKFNFVVKYVCADKVDGKYIPGLGESVTARAVLNGPAARRWAERAGADQDALGGAKSAAFSRR